MKHLYFCIVLLTSGFIYQNALADALTSSVERGRYLVTIADCNGCHTEGYAQAGGQMPEAQHLLGSKIGFAGPWGVSYPANLRLSIANLTEQQWLQRIDAGGLPPMPWPALRALNSDDKKAIYDYIRFLGSAGEVMPAAKAPGAPIDTLYFVLTPQVAQR